MPIYMKIEGIKGDVTAAGYEGSFEVLATSWGLVNAGGGTNFQDVNVVISELQGVTRIMAACATGRLLPAVQVMFVTEGAPARKYMEYKLENVLVSSYQTGGSTGALPTESFSLNFTKITYSVWFANQKGGFTEQSDSVSTGPA